MIIHSILDTDLYKFTTSYAYVKLFPYASGTFVFKDRDETRYTDEFLEALRAEVRDMAEVRLTKAELEYMASHCRFIPRVYWEWLQSFRFEPERIQIYLDEHHELHVEVEDFLYKATLYEVPLLAVITELGNRLLGHVAERDEVVARLFEKVELSNQHQLPFSEFGTRRRFSFAVQDGVINYLRHEYIENGCTEPKYHPLSRPAGCEAEAIDRMIHLAAMAGDAPLYIVHLSSKEGLLEVIKARKAHQANLAVETCTQYLTLTDDMYQDPREGLKAIMSPPLRRKEDNEALWAALRDDLLDTVATDHCPFNYQVEKQAGANDFTACPNGAPGVEERFRVMYSEGVAKGRISLTQFVKYLCTNPARMYGLYPQKGTLLPGSDADIVIFDPQKSRILTHDDMHSAVDYTCYEGMKVQGDIDLVMQRGNVIVKDNQFLGKRGDGRYLKRGKGIIAE